MSRLQGLELSLKHLNTPFLKPLVGIMYGFKHGQNETIAFNPKPAENLKEGFAFVQGAVVWYVVLHPGPASDQSAHLEVSLSRAASQHPLDAALKEYEEVMTTDGASCRGVVYL
jgi:hypothetical protein